MISSAWWNELGILDSQAKTLTSGVEVEGGGVLWCNSHLEVRMRSNDQTQNISFRLKSGTKKVERSLTLAPPPPPPTKKNPSPESSSHLPLLLYLTIPLGTLNHTNITGDRVAGFMREFHHIVRDYSTSILRRLSLSGSRKFWKEDWMTSVKSSCYAIYLDKALEGKRFFSQERMPPR